jgi:hypothetical protein
MFFKSSHRICRISVKILALLILIGPLCGTAWSQKAPQQPAQQTRSQSPQVLPEGIPDYARIDWYIAARYSVFGPVPLDTVDSKKLTFTGSRDNPGVTINLANKKVSVMSEAGASLPFSALAPGVRVTVCDRSDNVVIFVVSSRGSSHAVK